MTGDYKIRHLLVKHLEGGEAFLPLEQIITKLPFDKIGYRLPEVPYSIYELIHHIRFAQKDILDYCTKVSYKSPDWPNEYWPQYKFPKNEQEWETLKSGYFEERSQLAQFLLESKISLVNPVRPGTKHSLLREVLLVIEHTAYHTGQILIIMRALGLYNTGNDQGLNQK